MRGSANLSGFALLTQPPSPDSNATLELTVLMPCLNEAQTLASCVRKARSCIERLGLAAEVLVADNG